MKKLLCTMLAIAMLLSCTALAELEGVAAYEGERPSITIQWDAAWFADTGTNWPIIIVEDMSEYLNIDIEMKVWESKDQMALDIVSGDLADIIEVPGDYIPQLLDAVLHSGSMALLL